MDNINDLYKSLLDIENDHYSDEGEDFVTKEELEKMNKNPNVYKNLKASKLDDDIEEQLVFRTYSKRREHKYTETEMKQITESCEKTIVHDYSEKDIYHMSDEERAEKDTLNEISLRLSKLKRVYRKVDQYVEAMRTVYEAWDLLEKKSNFLHTRDEFFQLVGEGKIYNNRIVKPLLKGKNNYNMDIIIQYISNPELDVSTLVPKKEKIYDPWDDYNDESDETEEEKMNRLLSPQEVEFILNNADNPPPLYVDDVKPKYIKGFNERSYFGKYNKKKKKKKGNKSDRYKRESLHELLNKIQSNPNNNPTSQYSYIVTNNLFEFDKKPKNIWDDFYYKGSWSDDYGIYLHDLYIQEKILESRVPDSNYMTYDDRLTNDFFRVLESHGINTLELRRQMNQTADDLNSMEAKKMKKFSRKIESNILQRLMKLNNNSKFKKLSSKVEKQLNEYKEEDYDEEF